MTLGGGIAQQPSQHTLASGGRQQVGAPHHRVHPLQGVVNHHGQLIRPQPVGPAYGEIAHLARHVLRLRAQPTIVERLDALGHAHPPGACLAPGRNARSAGSHIRQLVHVGGHARLTRRIGNLAPGAAAPIEPPGGAEPVACGVVTDVALRLPHHLPVPAQAQRHELIHDDAVSPGHRARYIDILDAQQPLAGLGARIQIAGQRRNQRSRMQRPAGAGGETSNIGVRHGKGGTV